MEQKLAIKITQNAKSTDESKGDTREVAGIYWKMQVLDRGSGCLEFDYKKEHPVAPSFDDIDQLKDLFTTVDMFLKDSIEVVEDVKSKGFNVYNERITASYGHPYSWHLYYSKKVKWFSRDHVRMFLGDRHLFDLIDVVLCMRKHLKEKPFVINAS